MPAFCLRAWLCSFSLCTFVPLPLVLVSVLGIGTSFLCIAWALLDYHQSLRCFLQDKHKLDPLSAVIYFLWNFLLLCPRILSLTLLAVLFPRYVFLHFLGVWAAMFLWVSLQGTDFMEHAILEWLYRAVVAVILYFCWFNVSDGKTCQRSAIYYTFLIVDSCILIAAWLWNSTPLSGEDSYLLMALVAFLPCYVLGVLLRGLYYEKFHPTIQAAPLASYDEVDIGQPLRDSAVGLQEAAVNYRMLKLSQHYFAEASWELLHPGNGALGTTVV